MRVMVAMACSGFALSVLGNLLAVAWRKEEIGVGALWQAGSEVAAHPERFVRADRARVVQLVYLVGVGLIMASVIILVVMTIRNP